MTGGYECAPQNTNSGKTEVMCGGRARVIKVDINRLGGVSPTAMCLLCEHGNQKEKDQSRGGRKGK